MQFKTLHHFGLQALAANYLLCKISAEAIQKVPMQIKWSLEEDGAGGCQIGDA